MEAVSDVVCISDGAIDGRSDKKHGGDSNGTAEAAPTDTTIGSETNNSSSSVTNKCLRVLACAYAREYSGLEDVNHSLRAIVLDPIALLLVLEENLSAAARTGVAAMSEAQLCAVGGALATLVLHEAFGSDVEELVRDAPQGGGDEWLPRTLIPHWSELLVRVALTRISRKPVAEVCEHMERVLHFHEMVAPVRFSVHLPGQGGDDDFDTLLSLANSIRRFGELTTKRTSMVKHLLLFMKAFCRTSRREHTAIWDRMSEFVQNAHDRACLVLMREHAHPPAVRYVEPGESCAICMELMPREDMTIFAKGAHCSHIFCCECLTRVIRSRNTCPICREMLEYDVRVEVRRIVPELDEEKESKRA